MDQNAHVLCAHGRGCAECFAFLTDRINDLENRIAPLAQPKRGKTTDATSINDNEFYIRGHHPKFYIRGHHPTCFASRNTRAACGCGASNGPCGVENRIDDLVSLCSSVGGDMNKLIPWRGSVFDAQSAMGPSCSSPRQGAGTEHPAMKSEPSRPIWPSPRVPLVACSGSTTSQKGDMGRDKAMLRGRE